MDEIIENTYFPPKPKSLPKIAKLDPEIEKNDEPFDESLLTSPPPFNLKPEDIPYVSSGISVINPEI